MIVREIKDCPDLLKRFDWFNDYKDTRSWCVHNAPELVGRLDNGYSEWLSERRKRFIRQEPES